AVDLDSRLRLLKSLAHGAFDRRLVQLQIARRQSPEAGTRVDGPAAEKYAVFIGHHRTHHDLGVLVANEAAGAADEPGAGIAVQDFTDEGRVRPVGPGLTSS